MITAKSRFVSKNSSTIGHLCGGTIAAAGWEEAGFKNAWNIDFDPSNQELSNAIASLYEHNFGHSTIQQTLQEAVSIFQDLDKVDVLSISQPCPNFSGAKLRGKEDENDIAIAQSAAKAIAILLPEVVFIENVPRYQNSKSWAIIRQELYDNGYKISHKIFNCVNFGVPQSRERFIAIAHRSQKLEIPDRVDTPQIGWLEAIEDLIDDLQPCKPTEKQLKIASEDFDVPVLVERIGSKERSKIFQPWQPISTLRKSIFLDDRNCPRPHCYSLKMHTGEWLATDFHCVMRWSTIPDWFEFPLEHLWAAGAAIGNGIPPLFIKELGKIIKPTLRSQEPKGTGEDAIGQQMAAIGLAFKQAARFGKDLSPILSRWGSDGAYKSQQSKLLRGFSALEAFGEDVQLFVYE